MTLPDRALRIGRVVGTVEKHGDVVSITNTGLDLPRSHLRVDGNVRGVGAATDLEFKVSSGAFAFDEMARLIPWVPARPVQASFSATARGPLSKLATTIAFRSPAGDAVGDVVVGREGDDPARPLEFRGTLDLAHIDPGVWSNTPAGGGPRHRTRGVHVRAPGRQPRPAGARDVHADAHRRQRRRLRGSRRRGPRPLRRPARHAAAGPRPGLRRPVRYARHDRAARSRREGRPLRSDRPRRRHRRAAPAAAGAPPAPGDRHRGHLPRHARWAAVRRDDDLRRLDRRGRPRPRRLDRQLRPGARRDSLRSQGPARGPRPGTARRGARRRLAAGSTRRRSDDGRRRRAGAGPHARRPVAERARGAGPRHRRRRRRDGDDPGRADRESPARREHRRRRRARRSGGRDDRRLGRG